MASWGRALILISCIAGIVVVWAFTWIKHPLPVALVPNRT